MTKFKRVFTAILAGVLALSILFGLVAMIANVVNAKTSSEIQSEIDALEERSNEIAEQREALEGEIAENANKTLTIVEEKSQVDREIDLTRQSIDVVSEQIHQFSLLIAEKQAELDDLEAEQEAMFERYKQRMRAMQERGEISYWYVLLEAESFADMLNSRTMIEEIAKTDQRMMDELRQLAAQIMEAKEGLAADKAELEGKKAELAEAEEELAQKREESDALLTELISDRERLIEETEKYEAAEEELSNQIAALEVERTQALLAEWAAAHPAPTNNNGNDNDTDGDTDGGDSDDSDDTPAYEPPPSASEGFMFPLPSGIGVVLTSPYGYRTHPITGKYTFHNGVDLACSSGTPIYASKSGYITTATYNYAYGNYVTINHMDGYSTLYGHMTYFVVSYGDYVEQGQIIGYVGSTGYSTGPHLHFTIYDDGSTVNPMNYISLH